MTIQTFIVLYNETFKFVQEKYGNDAVLGLWKNLRETQLTHLDGLVARGGLAGMNEYWNGDDGTLSREQAGFEITYEPDRLFLIDMARCPSVGEIWESGREPMIGSLTYCDHCPNLYMPIGEKHGFKMTYEIEYEDDGRCTGRCKLKAEV